MLNLAVIWRALCQDHKKMLHMFQLSALCHASSTATMHEARTGGCVALFAFSCSGHDVHTAWMLQFAPCWPCRFSKLPLKGALPLRRLHHSPHSLVCCLWQRWALPTLWSSEPHLRLAPGVIWDLLHQCVAQMRQGSSCECFCL